MKKILISILIVWSAQAEAQDIFKEHLFPVEFIMANENKINLTDEQFEAISELYNKNIGDFNKNKWTLEREMRKLASIMGASRIDVEAATNQLEVVLGIEKQIKLLHISVLSSVRNKLTEEQIQKLSSIRKGP